MDFLTRVQLDQMSQFFGKQNEPKRMISARLCSPIEQCIGVKKSALPASFELLSKKVGILKCIFAGRKNSVGQKNDTAAEQNEAIRVGNKRCTMTEIIDKILTEWEANVGNSFYFLKIIN